MTYRLGVDVGGTFTDLALHNTENDSLEFAKIPSTPSNQAIGVFDGISQLIERFGIDPEQIRFFSHGTTVATNTLIDRTELYLSDEIFLTGTSLGITPVGQIDRFEIGDGTPGNITTAINNMYVNAALGKTKQYLDWVTPVYRN